MTAEELTHVARLRNGDGYESMTRQQLENTFTAPSEFIPMPIPISRPTPRPTPAIRTPLISRPRPVRTPEPFPTDVMNLKKRK